MYCDSLPLKECLQDTGVLCTAEQCRCASVYRSYNRILQLQLHGRHLLDTPLFLHPTSDRHNGATGTLRLVQLLVILGTVASNVATVLHDTAAEALQGR